MAVKPKTRIILILHNIRSLHNVGSIFRTADAAGVEKIYLCGITPAPVDRFSRIRPQLAKVSLGAEKHAKWEVRKQAVRLIEKLRKDGCKIFAVEQAEKSIPYCSPVLRPQSRRAERIALVLGNEVRGLPPSILKRADKILEIPMRGAVVRQAHHPRRVGRGKESLNVSVAAGIALFRLLYP